MANGRKVGFVYNFQPKQKQQLFTENTELSKCPLTSVQYDLKWIG